MKKVLITRKIPEIAREILEKKFSVTERDKKGSISKKELMESIGQYEAILTMFNDPIDREVLQKAKKLQVIANYAIGLNNIDIKCAKEKNIGVYNLPDIVTDSTADLTIAILLGLIRHIIPASEYVSQGKWNSFDPMIFLGEELQGKTFGIIGMGRCGQAVAKRASSFGLRIIFFNHSKKDIYEQLSFDQVLEQSDYLSLHVPLTDKTYHLLTKREFLKMKKKPVVINMARGAVIHTDDLTEALQKKIIRGAALDVTDPEPISSHPLCHMKNCLILPHIGTSTLECRYKMAKKAAENIVMHFNTPEEDHSIL